VIATPAGGDGAGSVSPVRRSFLVTGGAGFIGSHLVEALLARGDLVVAFDNLSTGRLRNLDHLGNHPNLQFVHGSVLDELAVDMLMHQCDVVVHLAAAVGVRLVVESPVRAIETNVHCTEVVLAQADRQRKPVLIASTSEVYGKSAALPFKEDGDLQMGATDKSRWAYACSKAIDEFLAMAYWRERGLPVIVVRLFNTVGPRQTGSYGMVVPTLVDQALAGAPLSVHGDGRQRRCFCHVADVVRALHGLLEEPRAYGNVFNVGSTEEVEIDELARRIIAMTGSASEICLTSYDEAYGEGFEDMLRRIPDISKVRALIGWAPERSLADIIGEVAQDRRAARVGV